MTGHPLTDGRAKLARAREHLDRLAAERDPLLDSYRYRVDTNYDIEQRAWIGRVGMEPPAPTLTGFTTRDFALVAGEFGAATRSALDYVVYQLAVRDQAGGVHPDDPGVRTQFPIFTRESDYLRRRGQMLAGLSEPNRVKIDSLQPFSRRNRRAIEQDPLTVLSWLTNTDKHRLAHSTAVMQWEGAAHVWCDPVVPPEWPAGTHPDIVHMLNWKVEDGAEVFHLRFNRPIRQIRVGVRMDVKLDIAIGERRVTGGRLEIVHRYVSDEWGEPHACGGGGLSGDVRAAAGLLP